MNKPLNHIGFKISYKKWNLTLHCYMEVMHSLSMGIMGLAFVFPFIIFCHFLYGELLPKILQYNSVKKFFLSYLKPLNLWSWAGGTRKMFINKSNDI